ncbi:hypothetical protein [Nocardioides euryhalodurans]|uniref:Uncharacterized protein n=1 Tax=Nocardioides euryhalodurans TaxID=2518370 RepID=A0A4P7GKP8_9ACTN|nr:hypothetical protein [Nocardioides euryhalodurans]QBR92650.1 hypothetical protein EXE57_10450 [Nocardioides euryhalodurans]
MAEKDPDGPSLELPSLGFRRKRKANRDEPSTEPPADPVEPAPRVTDEVPAAPEAPAVEAEQPAASPPPERRRRQPVSLPTIGALPAALVAGLVSGLLLVGLVWASLRLCEVVRGTSSCGNPGFLLLLAVTVLVGWVGAVVLRALGVPGAGSTSALGTGLIAVVSLLFLGDALFAWWMVIAVPLVGAASYAVAVWVSTALVEPVEDRMHR